METYFLSFIVVLIIGVVIAFANMLVISSRGKLNILNILLHLIGGLFYVAGAIGAIITGIIWIVKQFQ